MDEPVEIQAERLAQEYRTNSLYLALHAEVSALLAAVESEDPEEPADTPYVVMRKRGQTEAYRKVLSERFLRQLAFHAVVAKRIRADEQAPPRPPRDRDFWDIETTGDDLVS